MINLVGISDLSIRFAGERTVHAVNDLGFSRKPRAGIAQIGVVTPRDYG